MKKTISLLLLFLTPSIAGASCDRSSGNSLVAVQCMQEDYEKLDKELNQTYKKLLSDIVNDSENNQYYNSGEVKSHLSQAQKHWQQFIKSDCSAKFKVAEGGTGRDATELYCINMHVKQRIKELKEWSNE